MKRKTFISAGCVTSLLIACDDFLDPYPSAIRSEEYIWTNQSTVQGLIGQCYDFLSANYNDNEGAYLDGATDNAVRTVSTDIINRFSAGTISPTEDPFQTYWTRDYRGIYNVNMFLKDDRGYNTRFLLDDHQNDLLRARLKGEAFALRAWFQWDLLKKFGGRGTNGQMLGFPILLEPVNVAAMTPDEINTKLNFSRDTYEACVLRIIADCDSAYKYLPIAHRDFLVTSTEDKVVLGGQNWGRFDGITTVAIKALVYLTWASPRFNEENDPARWERAARFAKEVIDFKLTVDNVTNGFSVKKKVNWFDPNNPCIIFASRPKTGNEDMERAFYPGGFQGNGVLGATQELVDAFGMADGYPLGQSPTYAYNPARPYENRDPRFYSVIFYNDRVINPGSPATPYTFENHEGGKDAAGVSSKNSLTNYHIKKFVYNGVNWSNPTVSRMPHSKFHIRWAHLVLAFAEAANQYAGPNTPVHGLTAKEAISYLRGRTTYDDAPGLAADPYLDQVAISGKVAFDRFLRDERRIETCFEGLWFHDIRRWTTTLGELNREVHGVGVTKNAGNSFTYDFNRVVGTRVFTSAYLPIPYREVVNMTNMIQNEGWNSWQ
jgi:hypothetical protein